MKNLLSIFLIVFISFQFTSCKKCYTCTPICYECTYLSTHEFICRESFDNFDDFNRKVNTSRNSGYICTVIDSSSTREEICGNSSSVAAANADLKAQNGYKCNINR